MGVIQLIGIHIHKVIFAFPRYYAYFLSLGILHADYRLRLASHESCFEPFPSKRSNLIKAGGYA